MAALHCISSGLPLPPQAVTWQLIQSLTPTRTYREGASHHKSLLDAFTFSSLKVKVSSAVSEPVLKCLPLIKQRWN